MVCSLRGERLRREAPARRRRDAKPKRRACEPRGKLVIVMFEIGRQYSIEELSEHILPEIQRFCPTAPKLLVGCQLDSRDYDNEHWIQLVGLPITYQQGIEAAKRIGGWGYVECSAETRVGVAELFEAIFQMAVVIKTQPQSKRGATNPLIPFFQILPDPTSAPKEGIAPMPLGEWIQRYGSPQSLANQTLTRMNNARRPNNLTSEGDEGVLPRPNNIVDDGSPRPMNLASQGKRVACTIWRDA
ncbi:GTP-binding protein Rho1 [Ceratobasidium sp. 395]|nr:GTP-binding protein Rho1 [Ceratobasidium sp. 395]